MVERRGVGDDVGDVENTHDHGAQDYADPERDERLRHGPPVKSRGQGDNHDAERADGREQQIECGHEPSRSVGSTAP